MARHLLRLPPSADPSRAASLRAAAGGASARGDAGAAAHYLRRALEEPPSEGERAVVLYELGVAEALRDLGEPDSDLGVALEAELLAMGFHEFTSTELAAPHWDRRLSQLQAGEELDPLTLACLVIALAASLGPAAAAIRLADRVLNTTRLEQPNSVVPGLIGNGLIYAGAPSRLSLAPRSGARGSGPRRGMSCVRRSTRRHVRGRADWPIARMRSSSPRALVRAVTGGCCLGESR